MSNRTPHMITPSAYTQALTAAQRAERAAAAAQAAARTIAQWRAAAEEAPPLTYIELTDLEAAANPALDDCRTATKIAAEQTDAAALYARRVLETAHGSRTLGAEAAQFAQDAAAEAAAALGALGAALADYQRLRVAQDAAADVYAQVAEDAAARMGTEAAAADLYDLAKWARQTQAAAAATINNLANGRADIAQDEAQEILISAERAAAIIARFAQDAEAATI